MQRLSPDEPTRTNEILSNLTEIVIQLGSGVSPSHLNFTLPELFVPDASDVRVNVYWSLALIPSVRQLNSYISLIFINTFFLKISMATLALAGRGFLSMLTHSSGKPHQKLRDIYSRFESSEKILGPVIESLPVFLTVPVILFMIGLLDGIFSCASHLSQFSGTVRTAAFLSTSIVLLVGALLSYALLHACIYPRTSPFRSTVSQLVHHCLQHIFQSTALDSVRAFLVYTSRVYTGLTETRYSHQYPKGYMQPFHVHVSLLIHSFVGRITFHIVRILELDPSCGRFLDSDNMLLGSIYHKVIQETYDDESLDQASAALPSMLRSNGVYLHLWNILSDPEIQTLLHLLSPEASYRANRGAAESIVMVGNLGVLGCKILFRIGLFAHLGTETRFVGSICDDKGRADLLKALLDAARREYPQRLSNVDLWHSAFVRAIRVLIPPGQESGAIHGDLVFKGSARSGF